MEEEEHVGHATITTQRRSFLVMAGTAALAVLFGRRAADARSQSRPPTGVPALDPEDSQAKALHYVPDAKNVESESLNLKPTPAEAGQHCGNCQLFSGTPGAEWGPCAIFSYRKDPITGQNYVVSAKGWCRSWAPRAA